MSKAEALKDAGNKYFRKEDYVRAIKCYKEGLQLDPSNLTLNCNLAQAYLAVNEFADAEVHAVVTLANQSDSVKGFYRAAKAALLMEKRDRALSYLQIGLVKCPKAEELKKLYEEIILDNGNEDASSSVPSGSHDLENAENVKKEEEVYEGKNITSIIAQTSFFEVDRPSRIEQNKARSRSTSSRKRNGSKSSAIVANTRSTSVKDLAKLANENPKPEVSNEPQKDDFLDTLIKMRSELTAEEKSPELRERETLMEKQKKLKTYMKEGSEALEIGLFKHASEKYKSALDIMVECNIEIFGLSEVDRIILKYSLSISWIETRNYNNIVQSIGCLNEIVVIYASELPAVYFGLGRAFHQLNRFKAALNHLDKAANLIKSSAKIVPHPWPGTMKTILETTKIGLQESICNLQSECKIYRDPDAVCRYEHCKNISSHICPSEIIFFSDPDFMGYVVIICQENCKITYHVACWKHYKENLSSLKKFTDKDVLGQACMTSDCVNEKKKLSLIVRIEVYGENRELKTSCSKEPTKTDSVNEHRKEKKKKNERIDLQKPVKIKKARQIKKIIPGTLNSPKKIKRKSTISSKEFATSMHKLAALRNINFGFEEASIWNPKVNYFGRHDISTLQTFLNIHSMKDSETLRERKDFIFTYFYEYLNDEGPQKLSTLEKKWHEEVSLFTGVNEFVSQHDDICDFLLQSYRFARIDDYLCLTGQLIDTYETVHDELGESIAFILSNCSPHIDNETEDQLDIEMSKFVDNLTDDSSQIGFGCDFHMYECPDSEAACSSQTCSIGKQWNKKDSECDTYFIRATSDSDSDTETDFNEVDTDSENEYQNEFQHGGKCSYDENIENEDNNLTKNLTMETVILGTSPNDTSYIYDIAHGSCDSEHFRNQLQNSDIKNFKPEIPGIFEQRENNLQSLVLENMTVLTDRKFDVEMEIVNLRSNHQSNQEFEACKIESKECYQKEIEEYKQKLLHIENEYKSKLCEKEEYIKTLQQEIKNNKAKFESLQLKYDEKISNFSKNEEEGAKLLTKNIESITELNKILGKQAVATDRLEAHLKTSNEQILNLRKQFGEHKLDRYLEKCQERIQCMRTCIILFDETHSSSISYISTAIEAWEAVETKLQEIKHLLQIQYDILSQQLNSKVSSDCLLQLELADLPKEPFYPFEDVNNILHLAVEHVQIKNCAANENIKQRNNKEDLDNAAAVSPSSLLDIPHYQMNGNLYSASTSNDFAPPNTFRPHIYSNNVHGFSRPMEMYPTDHHFDPFQANPNMNTMDAGAWSSGNAFVRDRVGLYGNNVLEEMANITAQTSWNDHSNTQRISKLNSIKVPTSEMDLKVKDEKKGINLSTAGLTPIEIRNVGVGNEKWNCSQNPKPKTSEIKETTKPQKRWNYQMLLDELQKYFKFISEAELSVCLSFVRERNGNKLSGLPIVAIICNVEKILEERSIKKVGNLGIDKFGGTAWGEVKKDVSWQNDDDPEYECVICHINIQNNKTSLQCKHMFHTECIRKWLNTNSTCPICRKYTKLDDEFPPLG